MPATPSTTEARGVSIRRRAYDSVDGVIGQTPIVRLRRVAPPDGAEVFLKLEFANPGASVKDRIARAMIDDAERSGLINPQTHVIEPTSGNTGIALAMVCAAKGLKLTLCMPESMSIERRAMLKHLGAHLVLTAPELGMRGAITRAKELLDEESRRRTAWMPQQFDNPANPRIHEETTGPEVWDDMQGRVDCMVAGVGTGGTITGVTRFIRPRNAQFKAIAVEPADSPVISGGQPGPHRIQGIGAGFIPRNLDTSLLDEVLSITNEEAFDWARRLAREEGILAGISSGANVCAAARVAARPEFRGKRLVTFACSYAERYLSTPLFNKN